MPQTPTRRTGFVSRMEWTAGRRPGLCTATKRLVVLCVLVAVLGASRRHAANSNGPLSSVEGTATTASIDSKKQLGLEN